MNAMLQFYQRHHISPVIQDLSDVPAHFARRAGLYRSLGLPPIAIAGKSVLEVGPGSGCNATYTASLRPHRYVAVEPNPRGAFELEERHIGRLIVHGVRIEDYPVDEYFDVVLCEGVLGLCGTDPIPLLASIAGHVKRGGVLVITCIDAISDCAEVLRRAVANKLLRDATIESPLTIPEALAILRPVFTPHLATLKGMTRSVDDWIVDNLLNPASIGPTLSIPEAITALDSEFDVLNSSPRFLSDWRWYKASPPGNQWALDAYWTTCHNLLDYRKIEPPRPEQQNRDLMDVCLKLRASVAAIERGEDDELPPFTDPGWFGRGQQYLSLVRR